MSCLSLRPGQGSQSAGGSWGLGVGAGVKPCQGQLGPVRKAQPKPSLQGAGGFAAVGRALGPRASKSRHFEVSSFMLLTPAQLQDTCCPSPTKSCPACTAVLV